MSKALILYPHGVGDVIQLTPHLRSLYHQGLMVDIMCLPIVKKSKLLDHCPYVDKQIPVPNHWKSSLGFDRQIQETIAQFDDLKKKYKWAGRSCHLGIREGSNKIDFTSKELGLSVEDRRVEVFIPAEREEKALAYVKENYPGGYVYLHTMIAEHTYHDWNAINWVRENLPANLPIIDTGYKGDHYMWDDDINTTFALAREADYRVLSSSVMVHACDAMGVQMDVVNYGRSDRKVWPDDHKNKIKHIREGGKWLY